MNASGFRLPRWVCALAAALLFAPVSPAQPKGEPKLAAIRDRMQKFVDDGEVAGSVTLVVRGDGVLHFEAVGYQNLDGKIPMRKESLFRIASMTDRKSVV